MISLIWISDGIRKPAINLLQGSSILGREDGVNLLFNDPRVSSQHARLKVSDDHIFVEDLGSSNGTFVNGIQISSSVPVYDGDRLRIGDQLLIVEGATKRPEEKESSVSIPEVAVSAGGKKPLIDLSQLSASASSSSEIQTPPAPDKSSAVEISSSVQTSVENAPSQVKANKGEASSVEGEKVPSVEGDAKEQVSDDHALLLDRYKKQRKRVFHVAKLHKVDFKSLITSGRQRLQGRYAAVAFNTLLIALFIFFYPESDGHNEKREIQISMALEEVEEVIDEMSDAAPEEESSNSADIIVEGPEIDLSTVDIRESPLDIPIRSTLGELDFNSTGLRNNKNRGAGGVIAGRVRRAGGRSENVDIRVTLVWDTRDDGDLKVTEPSGYQIDHESGFYNKPNSPTGGVLDIDSNRAGKTQKTIKPVENIIWPRGRAPRGEYVVHAVLNSFDERSDSNKAVPFTVELVIEDKTFQFRGEFKPRVYGDPGNKVEVCRFSYPFDNDIVSNLHRVQTKEDKKAQLLREKEVEDLIIE